MEKHLFEFGGGSWAIIVPKTWVEKSGINKSSSINVRENEEGDLILSSKSSPSKEAELIVHSKIASEVVGWQVELYYIQGVKKLRIYSEEGLSASQSKIVEEVVGKSCPGFEVISRSQKDMVLENLADMREISLDKIISRIRSLITEELNEIAQVKEEEIEKLELLVNRFFMLGMRYLNITNGKDTLKYFRLIQLLEQISDNICRLSKISGQSKNQKVFKALGEEFKLCFKGLNDDYQATDAALGIRDSICKSFHPDRTNKLDDYLLVETARDIAKILDFGLGFDLKNEEAFLIK